MRMRAVPATVLWKSQSETYAILSTPKTKCVDRNRGGRDRYNGSMEIDLHKHGFDYLKASHLPPAPIDLITDC